MNDRSANDAHGNQPVPLPAILGAAALIVVSLLLVAAARSNGFGTTRMPQSTAVDTRELRFEDRKDGGVMIYDVGENRLIAALPPGTNGFLRGVMRGLTHERRREAIGTGPPFRLTRWADGRLSIEDPATGQRVNLEVFGPTNVAAFAALMSRGSKS